MTDKPFIAKNGLQVNGTLFVVNSSSNSIGVNTSSPAVSLHINTTDGILVPVGNTGQRPTSANGLFRYNTDTASFEGFSNGNWGNIAGGLTITFATTANLVANAANLAVSANSYWGLGLYQTLTFNVSQNWDCAQSVNFAVTLTNNAVLQFPSNPKFGQEGKILLTQDGTGNRTLSFASGLHFDTNTAPTINTTPSCISWLSYSIVNSTFCIILMPAIGL